MARASAVLIAALLAGVLLASAAVPGAEGPEFRVDVPIPYRSLAEFPAVAIDDAGGFMVVWSQEPVNLDANWMRQIMGRRYDAAGTPTGDPFRIGDASWSNELPDEADIAVDSTGEFVVVWTGREFTDFNQWYRVKGRQYDSSGDPKAGKFDVSSPGNDSVYYPAVGVDSVGNFVVAWGPWFPNYGQGSSSVQARQIDSSAVPLDDVFIVNPGFEPRVASDSSGNFVVVWSEQPSGPARNFAMRFDSTGAPLGSKIEVDPLPNTYSESDPNVAMDAAGNFVIVWTDGGTGEVLGQRFDSLGSPIGSRFQVDSPPPGRRGQNRPDVAMNTSGRFVVAWVDWHCNPNAIRGQQFDAAGQPLGGEFQVNTTNPRLSSYDRTSVSINSSGDFVVVWQGLDPPTVPFRDWFVLGQRFCGAPMVAGPMNAVACEGGPATLAVSATGREPLFHQWRKDGVDLQNGGGLIGVNGPTLFIDPVDPSAQGMYDCVDADACENVQTVVSVEAQLTTMPGPAEVSNLRVTATMNGAGLQFTWDDVAGADDYVVREDDLPNGAFAVTTGVATSGNPGLGAPMPPDIRYYLVAARTSICGEGPLR
jgi:hypothetical protein